MKAFMTLQHGDRPLGTLHLALYEEDVPKTAQNFAALLQRKGTSAAAGYLGCSFHRIVPGFVAQGGDFTAGDGTGGESIYGKTFADENFRHKHANPGALSMANAGPNTNGSQFFVTFRPAPHLDGRHVVFGHVDLSRSNDVLQALERVPTRSDDRPVQPVTIVECGIVKEPASDRDEDEIDLEEEELEETETRKPEKEDTASEEAPAEDDDEEEPVPKTKAEAMKLRLRKLKQKMNQARQLNKQAVKEEGERMNLQGRQRRREHAATKQLKEEAWKSANAKALETAAAAGVEGKHLTEQAVESVSKARARDEKKELNRFEVNDYYNPEGQYRNYQRSLKSLPQHVTGQSTATYNPLENEADPEQEREGARRLAAELHRRIEKSQKRERKRKQDEDTSDVSFINQRNKRFNEKISRTYDKQTAEIRQNLERGTAL
jgi:cyclophilin family peptidyl-prolyl cis-trans isomerase